MKVVTAPTSLEAESEKKGGAAGGSHPKRRTIDGNQLSQKSDEFKLISKRTVCHEPDRFARTEKLPDGQERLLGLIRDYGSRLMSFRLIFDFLSSESLRFITDHVKMI